MRSTSGDEFVELYNPGNQAVDLSGWSLFDKTSQRHVFSGDSWIMPSGFLVVFGGGSPQLPGVATQIASSGGLSLNNGGDEVRLFDAMDRLINAVIYGSEGGSNQSLAASPEWSGKDFTGHLSLPGADNIPFSPGIFVNPPSSKRQGPPAVPEPVSMVTLGLGFVGLLIKRKLV